MQQGEQTSPRCWKRIGLLVLLVLNAIVWMHTTRISNTVVCPWEQQQQQQQQQLRYYSLPHAKTLVYNGLSTNDIQVFSSVRGSTEIDALTASWGKLFSHFHFIVSNKSLQSDAIATPRKFEYDGACPNCSHTVVATRSVDAGIRQTLVVKLWHYLRWACNKAAAARNGSASTPEGTKWLLRVDSDTFVFVPRLLRFLSQFDPDKPQMLAYMWSGVPGGLKGPPIVWPSGGAGVAISQACFSKMCPRIMSATERSVTSLIYDDVMLGVFAARGGAVLEAHEDIFSWHPPSQSLRQASTVAVLHDIDSSADLKQIGATIYDVFLSYLVPP